MGNSNISGVSSPNTHLWYEHEQCFQTCFLGMATSAHALEKIQKPVLLRANGGKQLTELTVSNYVAAPGSPSIEEPPQIDPLLAFDLYQTIIFDEDKQQFSVEPSKLINAVDRVMKGMLEPVEVKNSPVDEHLQFVSTGVEKASRKRLHSRTSAATPTLSETVRALKKRLRSSARAATIRETSTATSSKVKHSAQLVSDHSSSNEDPTKWIIRLPKSEKPYTHSCGYQECKAKCFPCQICGFKFCRKDHLQSHMKVVHGNTLQWSPSLRGRYG